MSVTLPIDVFETFEKAFGKAEAKKVIKSLEKAISEYSDYKWATTKEELLEKLATEKQLKEFENTTADKFSEFEKRIEQRFLEFEQKVASKEELAILQQKFETFKLEIENRLLQLDRKFSIYFIVILFAILFVNQNALSFIARLLGVVP